MSKKITIILSIILCVLCFRAYKTYQDVNKLLENEIIIAKAVNIQDAELNGTKDNPSGLTNFIVSEFPSQIIDYKNKLTPAK